MAKELSDIVRDKIIKARKGRSDSLLSKGIHLTDEEASELWSRLSDVEAKVYFLRENFKKSIKELEDTLKFFRIPS